MNKAAVVVSAYSSGTQVVEYLYTLGFHVLHFITEREWSIPWIRQSLKLQHITKNVIVSSYCDAKKILLSLLNEFQIIAVMPGAEYGVPLTDHLAQYVDCYRNNRKTTVFRRNKFAMCNQVVSSGVDVPKQILVQSVNDIRNWLVDAAVKKIILKPVDSSGSDGVKLCTRATVEQAAQILLASKNKYGIKNNTVLVQEFVFGDEYIINSFSAFGKHKVLDVWKGDGNERGTAISNDNYASLLHPEDEAHKKIVTLIPTILDILDVKFGAAHTELIIKEDGSACFLEAGFRLGGQVNYSAITEIFGNNPLELFYRSYVTGVGFGDINSTPQYKARYVYFNSPVEGYVKRMPDVSVKKTLNSLL